MSKEIVMAVQTRLKDLNYYAGAIDGDAGARTEAALTDFKRAQGLTPRPYPCIQTLHLLYDEDAKPRAKPIIVASGEPAWMVEARSVKGLHEANSYGELSAWLRSDGSTLGDPRKLPWCGDFVQTAIALTLPGEAIPANPYLARNWLKFGQETEPRLGAVLVFWRGSRSGISGHVGFYVGEDAETYHVLGGNQSNAVTVTRLSKSRLLGARWPVTDSSTTHSQQLAATGEISTNEA
ncbi:TIGR02594 family protein [Fulvimarina manganoxydans]|uniref:TIGR02594 family protein n=1 Tax=Fulvimarina manganoxydans TaxID=937218 RepID=A0A1W2EKX5_9HYPH|nr:TIGR02594 family protein [Fulvimarina manganoxydans]SMD09936.1 TIGR02594 family protein [Fulvimarina manganoxydans]